ncbi:MAG: glycerol kinase GlpK [Lachnospira sp.]|nr:glycerol kinase GlpK [Lachnospira sp.]
MTGKYIMALDQGTTSSRCIIYDHSGNVCSVAQKEFDQIYPKAGWIEHNPMEIWSSQLGVAMEALVIAGLTYRDISGIGITNQRETTIVWDKETGVPVYNAIVWQCRRTAERIDQLVADGLTDKVRTTTGLVPDAYFSASKIEWILDHVEGARKQAEEGKLLFGTVDSWLVWKLTKGKVHITDYTNASRTMLFDIHKLAWDQELLDYFHIPRQMLPEVKPSSYIYGHSDATVIGGEIPIAGIAGDQQAALFGQCCFDAGEAKNTYGTGCFLLMNTGEQAITSKNGLITTIAATTREGQIQYALEGSVFVAGAAIQWLRDSMRMLKTSAQSQEYAEAVDNTEGVYLVPAFTGLGAPYWDQYARGTIVGITRGCTKEHFIRATLESIDYQVADVLHAMEEDSDIHLRSLKVDGGASANDFLMQFEADILNTEVHRPKSIETTSLGAAYLAGLATGYWQSQEEIKKNWELGKSFLPYMKEEKRTELLKGWKKAVKCARIWAED